MMPMIYCATDAQVGPTETRALLELAQFRAIWAPPPRFRGGWPRIPAPGEWLWLCWRPQRQQGSVLVLAGGSLVANARQVYGTWMLFTDLDLPGVRDAAAALGYDAHPATSYLQLQEEPHFAAGGVQHANVGPLNPGLNDALPAQAAALHAVLAVV